MMHHWNEYHKEKELDMTLHTIGPDVSSSDGRRSLDRSVWYNGWLMTFLATGEETQGQFALIEGVGRRGDVPPPHTHHREEETFYVMEGEMTFSVGGKTIKGTPGTMVCQPRDVEHSFVIDSEEARLLILVTPAGFEGWFKEFSVPAPAMTLPPADEPAYGEVQRMLEAAPRYGLVFPCRKHGEWKFPLRRSGLAQRAAEHSINPSEEVIGPGQLRVRSSLPTTTPRVPLRRSK